MATNTEDVLWYIHPSLQEVIDSIKTMFASYVWLAETAEKAWQVYTSRNWDIILKLPCSVLPGKAVKIEKNIINLFRGTRTMQPVEGGVYAFINDLKTRKIIVNHYRLATIAVKDIVWKDSAFLKVLSTPECQFLKHLRNASAHHNEFFWGTGGSRKSTLKSLPVSWRGKEINETMEGTALYFDFLTFGDFPLLISDISSLAKKHNEEKITT